MELTPEHSQHPTRILRYEPGLLLCVSGSYRHSVVISKEQVLPFSRRSFHELSPDDLLSVLTPETELLLLGTGPVLNYPLSRSFLAPLEAHGVSFEAMTTPAACRTFELLVAEGRQVMAVLLLE